METKLEKKNKLVFRIEKTTGAYPETYIRIQTMNEIKVSERIYWSCADPDYFGKPDKYQQLAVLGYDTYYEMDNERFQVYLSYLHYEGDSIQPAGYCSHKISEVDNGLIGLTWATKLLTKLARGIAKQQKEYYGPKENYSYKLDNPKVVVEALLALGAVEIEYTKGPISSSAAVQRFSAPHQWLNAA